MVHKEEEKEGEEVLFILALILFTLITTVLFPS